MSDTVKYARLSSITGLIFAALLVLALVFVHSAPNLKASEADFAAFYAGNSTVLVTVGLYLVPFAGIAFLWHMNTVRLLIRTRTPEPSAIPDGLQLMAGILFVALLFAGTAASGGCGHAEGPGIGSVAVHGRGPWAARGRLQHGVRLLRPRRRDVRADHHHAAGERRDPAAGGSPWSATCWRRSC